MYLKFIQFHKGSLDSVSRSDVWRFADQLDKKGDENWQVQQAQSAINFYIRDFSGKKILEDTQQHEHKSTPVSPVLSWMQAKD